MRRFVFLAFLAILATSGYAQKKGSLNVDQDSRIEKLMKKQRDVYAANSTMSGYRVQIFMEIGNEAIRHAEAMKRSFTDAFPELPVYLSYDQPYYRLRVGDFRNRVEAEKYMRLIKPKFSLACVTADIINPPRALPEVTLEEEIEEGEETFDEEY